MTDHASRAVYQSEPSDRPWLAAIFLGLFLAILLAFPMSSPGEYYFNWDMPNLFNEYVYYALIGLASAAIVTKIWNSDPVYSGLLYWSIYFIAVVLVMFVDGRPRVNVGIGCLLIFASPSAIRGYKLPVLAAIGAAASLSAAYGIAGSMSAQLGLAYDKFPIVPYLYDGDLKLGPGFTQAFSPGLFLQTNAAGAIYGAAFCLFLFQLLSEERRDKIQIIVTLICLVGLVFSRSLAALLVAGLLSALVLRGRALAMLMLGVALCGAVVLLTPDGFLGINAAFLEHKLESSAAVKVSLLFDNALRLTRDGILATLLPGREPPLGTENSFIDLAYQFGPVPLILFYCWCAIHLRIFEDRRRVLLLFPIILSFIQNSAFTTPSVLILGAALAIYGNNGKPSARDNQRSASAA